MVTRWHLAPAILSLLHRRGARMLRFGDVVNGFFGAHGLALREFGLTALFPDDQGGVLSGIIQGFGQRHEAAQKEAPICFKKPGDLY